MKSKKNLREIVEIVKVRTGMTQEQIANKLSYNRTYLSDAIGRNLESVIRKMELVFAEQLADKINKKPTDIEFSMSGLYEDMIALNARLNVVEQMVDLTVHNQTGQSIALVSGERMKAVKMEAERLSAEFHKKHKV